MPGEDDLDLAVGKPSGSSDRVLHDRLPSRVAQATLPAPGAHHAGLAVNGFARSALASLAGRLRPLTAALRRGARCAGNPARFHASKEFGHEHPRYIACP